MIKILVKLILFLMLVVGASSFYIYHNTDIPSEDTLLSSSVNTDPAEQCINIAEPTPIDRHGNLDIATWNIYKQTKDDWLSVLTTLTDRTELLLLQEVSQSVELTQQLEILKEAWVLSKAFVYEGEPIGVMNISAGYPISSCSYRLAEPLIKYPKSLLISHYLLSDSSQLLVINIHSVNFTLGLKAYRQQLEIVATAMNSHTGPIILAGDLNTWSQERLSYIQELVKQAGLTEAIPKDDSRTTFMGSPLDHIFYRELQLVNTESIVTDSSDHNPVKAYFRLQRKRPQ
ncbi:endonuclease/exonuclease/phosphatase family protein [Shewanella youngdeokensis]|uniref:Endonuclease/exonuclease/phosphatase family protein n=1 Tax=Shewanella youngdeokensis TaxID=2999068 RepID=A0ABZ0JV53_9GAMM|nr:endonuclease/exonuclease/phosphatase family protein [Shewanella sp. DAU334]